MAVNLYFSTDLKDDIIVDNLFFGDDFESYNHFMFSLSCEIHMSIFSFTKVSTNLEILYGPITWMEDFCLWLVEEIFGCVVDDLFEQGDFINFGDFNKILISGLPITSIV